MTVTRPALRYYGGKWSLADWIIQHFPPHDAYVEPYGGSAAVLLKKSPAKLEVLNDMDGRVVNFFRVVRERHAELIDLLQWTPYSYAEYRASYERSDDPLEDARRFFVQCWQSIGAEPAHKDGWRAVRCESVGRVSPPAQMRKAVAGLQQIAERLSLVQIDSRPAEYVIGAHDAPGVLLYVDPPYLHETRTNTRGYTAETGDADHVALLEIINDLRGYVVLSGYDNELYDGALEGWHRVDQIARTTGNGNGGITHRTESLWLSPRTYDAVFRRHANLPLFANGAAA